MTCRRQGNRKPDGRHQWRVGGERSGRGRCLAVAKVFKLLSPQPKSKGCNKVADLLVLVERGVVLALHVQDLPPEAKFVCAASLKEGTGTQAVHKRNKRLARACICLHDQPITRKTAGRHFRLILFTTAGFPALDHPVKLHQNPATYLRGRMA